MKSITELNNSLNKIIEACPELVFIGNAVLRKKTENIHLPEALKIAEQLKKTLATIRDIAGYGRGLAAPQIGLSKSIFITFVDETFTTYINPTITQSSSQKNCYREGCLSCGSIWSDVQRPASITIKYTDEQGDKKTEKADGFLARLLQHEYDHLRGIVNIDIAKPTTIEFMVDDPLQEQLRDC